VTARLDWGHDDHRKVRKRTFPTYGDEITAAAVSSLRDGSCVVSQLKKTITCCRTRLDLKSLTQCPDRRSLGRREGSNIGIRWTGANRESGNRTEIPHNRWKVAGDPRRWSSVRAHGSHRGRNLIVTGAGGVDSHIHSFRPTSVMSFLSKEKTRQKITTMAWGWGTVRHRYQTRRNAHRAPGTVAAKCSRVPDDSLAVSVEFGSGHQGNGIEPRRSGRYESRRRVRFFETPTEDVDGETNCSKIERACAVADKMDVPM